MCENWSYPKLWCRVLLVGYRSSSELGRLVVQAPQVSKSRDGRSAGAKLGVVGLGGMGNGLKGGMGVASDSDSVDSGCLCHVHDLVELPNGP